LLDRGKRELEARRHEEALTALRRAHAEDASLVEALYWRAIVHERLRQMGPARTTYRAFRSAYQAERAGGRGKPELDKLLERVLTRLEELPGAEEELLRLHGAFVRDVVAWARKQEEEDPAFALRAASACIAVQPVDGDATQIARRLRAVVERPPVVRPGPNPPAPAGAPEAGHAPLPPGAYPGTGRWHDVLASRGLGVHEGWGYGPEGLTIDAKPSDTGAWPSPAFVLPRSYVLEMDFRVLRLKLPAWRVGLRCGGDGSATYVLTTWTEGALRVHVVTGGAAQEVASVPLAKGDGLDARRRLAIDVEETRLRVWIDGSVRLDHRIEAPAQLEGQCALYYESCVPEFRAVRLRTAE
jgi:hypothetical protein